MNVKTPIAQALSLRAKFKSTSRIEVVVIDSRTNEEFCYWIDFRENTIQSSSKVNEPENKEGGDSNDEQSD